MGKNRYQEYLEGLIPVETLANALQDRIHKEIGVSRPARSVKVASRKKQRQLYHPVKDEKKGGQVKPEYQKWIAENYPTLKSATLQCADATERMVQAFPELRRVRGQVFVMVDLRPHWWCVDGDGEVVDPTAHQWDFPVIEYHPHNEDLGEPKCKCMNCGELVFASKYTYHCDPCGDAGCRF